MKILLINPMEHPQIVDIPHTLEAMQHTVGGLIEVVRPWEDDVALICDEEFHYHGGEWNREINDWLTIRGTFFVCGTDDDSGELVDLSPELCEKYMELLYEPHVFIEADGVLVRLA